MSRQRDPMKAGAYDAARRVVDTVAVPVGGVLATPVRWADEGVDYVRSYFFAVSQNRRLQAELVQAQSWRDQLAAAQADNARLRAVLGIQTNPPLPHVAAETIADSRGPFADTRLANVGADKGVTEGNPVLSEYGLVGRIVGVSDHVSRILLLTDASSRTPVLLVRTNGRAILTGDGGASPKLDYVRSSGPLRQGDLVLTSGDGGVFPRGLPIGTVIKGFDGGWRVALDSDAAPIDYVQILLFTSFAQLVNEQALAPKELPTAMTEEPGQSIVEPAPGGSAPGAAAAGAAAAKSRPAKASAVVRKTPASASAGTHERTAKPLEAERAPADAGASQAAGQ